MTTATGAATSSGNNDSNGGFHDGGGSNGNWQQQQETATGDGNGQKQRTTGNCSSDDGKVATEVKAANMSTQQRTVTAGKGSDSRKGGNGREGSLQQ